MERKPIGLRLVPLMEQLCGQCFDRDQPLRKSQRWANWTRVSGPSTCGNGSGDVLPAGYHRYSGTPLWDLRGVPGVHDQVDLPTPPAAPGEAAPPPGHWPLWGWVLALGVPHYILPGPVRVWNSLLQISANGDLWSNLGITLGRVAAGFILATVIGLPLGILFGALTVGAIFWMYSRDLPSHESLAQYTPPTISRIYSGEGRIIDVPRRHHRNGSLDHGERSRSRPRERIRRSAHSARQPRRPQCRRNRRRHVLHEHW